MIFTVQRPWGQFRDITVIWSYQTSLETAICGAWVSFRRPFTPNIVRIYAATNGLGGGAQIDFVPERGKP